MVECNCVGCKRQGHLFGVMFRDNPKTTKSDEIYIYYCSEHFERLGKRLTNTKSFNTTNLRMLTEKEREHAKTIHFEKGVLVRNGVVL